MENKDRLDIYTLLSRNRLRLVSLFAVFSFLVMGFSALGVYLVHRLLHMKPDFWLVLILFWLIYIPYVILRYTLGGKWIFRRVITLPPHHTDRRLENALNAAVLGAGITARVRLLEIPHRDINSFSLSLADGSFAVFATRGISEKLPPREREAIMAHELTHIAAGDTTMQSVPLRLVGPGGSLNRSGEITLLRPNKGIFLAFLLPLLALFLYSALKPVWSSPPVLFYILSLVFLLAVLASALPFLMHKLMRLFLDREREYFADLQASYIIRDPEAVYLAVKDAAEDVRDLLVLPSHLDAILFHPVVEYTSYRPFRTQPTMADRMRRLKESFPELQV